jgi:hypothetical protein
MPQRGVEEAKRVAGDRGVDGNAIDTRRVGAELGEDLREPGSTGREEDEVARVGDLARAG